jgi:CRP/FNR family transcriptional regulator, anaerobic regulatory protein
LSRILYYIDEIIGPSEEEKEALAKILNARILTTGEKFLSAGEVCNKIAFVEKGSVRTYYEKGEATICREFLFENSLIGSFTSFFCQATSLINVSALEDSVILEMTFKDVMQLYSEYPSWKKLGLMLLQDHLLRSEQREASATTDTSEARFRKLLNEQPEVIKRVPLEYIASYLGITMETLTYYWSLIHEN